MRPATSGRPALRGSGWGHRHWQIALAALCLSSATGARAAAVVPPSLLEDSQAKYPPECERLGVGGDVVLELLIDERGEVQRTRVMSAPNPELAEAALHASTTLRFTPALVDGEPHSAVAAFEYHFVPPPQPQARLPAASAYQTVVKGAHAPPDPSTITLGARELNEVAGTMGDPLRAVMLLPGVSSIASGLAYPVVRGTQPASTGVYLDGIRLPLLYHLFLGPSVVQPDLVQQLDFHPGLPPPQMGRLLGGAVSATTRPLSKTVRGAAYADLLNAGGVAESGLLPMGGAISLAGRVSYSPFVLNRASEVLQPNVRRKLQLDYYDYQARMEQPLGPVSTRVFALGSSDVASTMVDDDTHSVVFHRLDVRVRPTSSPTGTAELGVTVGLDRLEHKGVLASGGSDTYSLDTSSLAARAQLTRPLASNVVLGMGGDVEQQRARKRRVVEEPLVSSDGTSNQPQVAAGPLALATFGGAYASLDWQPTSDVVVTPTIRIDAYHLDSGTTLMAFEPRVGGRWAITPRFGLRAEAGLLSQPPSTLISVPAVDLSSLEHGLQRALHVSSGAQWKTPMGWELQLGGFWTRLLRTVEVNPFADEAFQGLEVAQRLEQALAPSQSVSDGYAYGIEMLARRPIADGWFAWCSYTLQRSVRRLTFSRATELGMPGEQQAMVYVPFALDQTHVLNAAVSGRILGGISVGASVHLNTGRPESGGTTSYTQRAVQTGEESYWAPVDPDQTARLPMFLRADARISNAFSLGPVKTEVYLDLFNITLAQEIVGYRYERVETEQGVQLQKMADGARFALPVLGVKGAY